MTGKKARSPGARPRRRKGAAARRPRAERAAHSSGDARVRAAPRARSGPASAGSRALLVCVALGGTLAALGLALLAWGRLAGSGHGDRIEIDWTPASDGAEAAAELSAAGVRRSPLLLSLYLRWFGRVSEFRAGPHLLASDLSAREIVQRLARTTPRASAKIVVPEGMTSRQLAERLDDLGVCSARSFVAATRDPALVALTGNPGESVEGYLFPATYDVPLDQSASAVVSLMVSQARARLDKALAARPGALQALAKSHAFGERELVTLASIVEREARVAEERPLIASVYLNRLVDPDFLPRRMLQADPTAAYGCAAEPERAPSCAGFSGKVTPEMVRDPANRWNTYVHAGLPPGPIANPGIAAIDAVLTAPRTDYLFFVHTGGGRHSFSRTFDEHRRAITGP